MVSMGDSEWYFLVKVAKKSIQTEMLWENKELTMAKKLIKKHF